MMFMTPIPPTISDMLAIEAIMSAKVAVTLLTAFRMSSVFRITKSFTRWRNSKKRVMSCSAAAVSVSSLTLTTMLRREVVPRQRACLVVDGQFLARAVAALLFLCNSDNLARYAAHENRLAYRPRGIVGKKMSVLSCRR